MNRIKKLAIYFFPLLVVLITLEASGYVFSKYGLLLFNEIPTAYLNGVAEGNRTGRGVEWRTENSAWGAWHKPNSVDYHITKCFNVRYEANEVGARDDSFVSLPEKGKRYLLLGDSFAEGWGVAKGDTVDAHLEKMLGASVLNFGSAGDFGPVQYRLIYNQLARNYRHDGVIVFFLPSNDFTDNDPSLIKKRGSLVRWRPYYRKVGEGKYVEDYPAGALKRDDWVPRGFSYQMQHFAAMYLWSFNIYRTAQFILDGNTRSRNSYSGYYDADMEQQKAAVYYIKAIIDEASPKPITLVIIPRQEDFARIDAGEALDQQYWYRSLMDLSSERKNIKVIDLAKFRDADVKELFLPCDGHWSGLGNAWAARHIAENM